MPPECPFYTQSKFFRGKGLHQASKRNFDLIDCVALDTCKRRRITLPYVKTELAETLVDLSQSHERRPFSHANVAHTLTTGSRLYHFGQDRLCVGREHLLLQGYEADTMIPTSMSDADIKRLAGEGIALPVLGLILWSLFLAKGLPVPE